MDLREFTPKLFTLLKEGISARQISRDLFSGIIVGIIALPLSIAFAIASGVSPDKGLVTAIIAGFFISVFGGSRVQIGGPTGAFIVIVYGIVQQYGVEGLTVATFIAGFMIMLMGFLRFGSLLKYFPFTLIVGFTAGIAVIIFSSQIKDLLGLEMGAVPSGFIEKWAEYGRHLTAANLYAALIGLGTIAVILLFTRITSKVPSPLIAIVLSTLAVYFFQLPVDTISSRFGTIPNTLPMPKFYSVDFETFKNLLAPALAIAMLGGIESLLSAVVADGMIGGRHRSNMELVAQGGANILSAMFGGIPATGAIARTAANIKNGGRTPISGVVHALTLLVIMLLAAPLAGLIPLACLAGILVVVAWNMAELHTFAAILRSNRYDAAVLLVTFFLTVVFDLVVAIEIGMVLAAFLFIKRMADATSLGQMFDAQTAGDSPLFEDEFGKIPPHIAVYEINGPLFFGAAQRFFDALKDLGDRHSVLILRMRHVSIIDATGMKRLEDLVRLLEGRGVKVVLSGVSPRIMDDLLKAGFIDVERMQPDMEAALKWVSELSRKS